MTENKIEVAAARWLAAQRRDLHGYLGVCESPIEQLLLLAMLSEPTERRFAPWPDFTPDAMKIPCEGLPVSPPLAIDGFAPYGLYGPNSTEASDARRASGVENGVQVGWDYYGKDMGVLFLYIQAETRVDGRNVRLDIAFIGESYKLAVECDGHDFHERTKEQAAKDRSRDRALQANGWNVLRFTGSEIWKDAELCASEVKRAIETESLRRCVGARK